MGRRDEARPLYERATQASEGSGYVESNCGVAQGRTAWQNSETCFETCARTRWGEIRPRFIEGRMLVVFKRYQESESFLKLATE